MRRVVSRGLALWITIHSKAYSQPTELLALQVRIFDQAEDGGIAQRCLVERLEAVDDKDDGQDGPVNLPEDTLVVFGGDNHEVSSLFEHLGCFVSTSAVRFVERDSFDGLRVHISHLVVGRRRHSGIGFVGSAIHEQGKCVSAGITQS